jgi:hypothetical protein
VIWTWAAIKMAKSLPSFLSPMGYAISESTESPTHSIIIRNLTDLEITSAAWVYEEKRKSAPRWYKFLGFSEEWDNWLLLRTHLVERSDKAQPPVDKLRAQPSNVVLT